MKEPLTTLSASLVLALSAVPSVAAEPLTEDKLQVLSCLEQLDQGAEWSQCLDLMFGPCAEHKVGSEVHLACLGEERLSWRLVLVELQAQVFEAVTPSGASDLATLLGQWTGYVVQKCEAVGTARADISSEAGQLGCEITEMVGLSGEFAACLEGRSAAPYCSYPQN
ncbi:MAG: hypothetical protein HKP40_14170 [Litoreibacter sp.]|nr:hypothetical protein [Litoreibacter sp.]